MDKTPGVKTGALNRLRAWFLSYAGAFKAGNPGANDMMVLKEEHSFRVCLAVIEIGRCLGLSVEDLNLAEAAALLHDIGRFEQFERYNTFSDRKSVDHARLGVSICREKQVLSELDPETEDLILRMITYHNLPAVPLNETPACLFYSGLLRDADKLDIWDVVLESYESPAGIQHAALVHDLPDDPEVSPRVVESIRRGVIVHAGDLRTLSDFKLLHMSWIFDINFRRTFEIIRERRYLERLRDTLKGTKGAEEAYRFVRRAALTGSVEAPDHIGRRYGHE